jgi:hypothetical protein
MCNQGIEEWAATIEAISETFSPSANRLQGFQLVRSCQSEARTAERLDCSLRRLETAAFLDSQFMDVSVLFESVFAVLSVNKNVSRQVGTPRLL